MKTLFFANTDWYLYHFRLALARQVRRGGGEVLMVSPRGPYAARLQAEGFRWIEFPISRSGVNPFAELSTVRRLRALYRRERPGLAHHFTPKCVIYGGIAARFAGGPAVVQSVTGLGSLFARGHWRAAALRAVVRPLYRLALGGASTIFQSSADRDEFVRGRLVDPARVHVIRGSGVDVARFRPAQPAATGAPRVIFVARLLREKGVETLVEAARRVRATHPQVRFSVVGEPDPGNPSSITGAELERWRSEGAVEFLGHRDDVDALMREASIFALPTYYREGVPRSLIEAAASGLALIATDQPGCLEVVQPEVTGAVIAARDPEALAAAIRRLADHPELRAAWGRAARAAACERFSEERVLEETAAVYAVALGRMKP